MPSKYIYKAFDTLGKTFQKLNKTPIEWDIQNQKWEYTKSRWKLKIWYFDISVVVFCGMFCSTWGILGKQFLAPDGRIPFIKLLVFWFLGLLEIAGLGFFMTMIHFGQGYVQGFNQLMDLEKNLQRMESNLKSTKYDGNAKLDKQRESGYQMHDILGKMLIPLIHFFYHSPVSLTFCALFLDLDPFCYVIVYLEDYIVLSSTTRVLCHILRTLLMLITALEVCRLWPLLLLLLISHFMMINDCLKMMFRATKKIGISSLKMSRLDSKILHVLMDKYNHLLLTLVLCQSYLLNVTFIFISIGMLVGSLCNFAVIKFIYIIPFFVYQFFLSVSIIIPCVVHSTLPYCHRINDTSTELIGAWKSLDPNLGVMKRGYWIRQAKSVQSLKIYTGIKRLRLFWLGKKTKMRYQDAILMRTVDLLLSIPQSSFQNMVAEMSLFGH